MKRKFTVMITNRAKKQIKKLNGEVLPRVIECLEKLEFDQHPTGVEKLNQNPNFWRLKAGSTHRVVYTIVEEQRVIVVALVSPRREVYREVANLNRARLIEIASNDDAVGTVATATHH